MGTIVQPAPAARLVARVSPRALIIASYVLVGLVALLPRALNLGQFATIDEVRHWVPRSMTFLAALQSGDYAATAMTEHPGVTTMWLGTIGLLLREVLLRAGLVGAGEPTRLALMQFAAVLAHTAGLLLGYRLLRRMFAAPAALLAALLWATDPFIIAYSRLLHVDALMGTFATVSLLAACVFWTEGGARRWLAVSGVCAGLAVLTKTPGWGLVPVVGLLALAPRAQGDRRRATERDEPRRVQPVARLTAVSNGRWATLVLWGVLLVVTVFALWPALWVNPKSVYESLRGSVEDEGGVIHKGGNFFLGVIDDNPGPLFYPIAIVMRLTPWALLGLLLVPLTVRRLSASPRRHVATLACFAVLFIAALTVFPNKLNRYIEPIFPALDIIAAVALYHILLLIDAWWRRRSVAPAPPSIQHLSGALCASVLALGVGTIASYHPYTIGYFSPLFGGPQAGARTFLLGIGEGMEQAAAWLNTQVDVTEVPTMSTHNPTLFPYLREGAILSVAPPDPSSGYIVVYVRQTQGELEEPYATYYATKIPDHIVSMHGVEYARIYRVPYKISTVLDARFGGDLHLRGYIGSNRRIRRGDDRQFQLIWDADALPATNYRMTMWLLGPDGKTYGQDIRTFPTSSWTTTRQMVTSLAVDVPKNAPLGSYQVVVALDNPATGERLPLSVAPPFTTLPIGPHALQIATLKVR